MILFIHYSLGFLALGRGYLHAATPKPGLLLMQNNFKMSSYRNDPEYEIFQGKPFFCVIHFEVLLRLEYLMWKSEKSVAVPILCYHYDVLSRVFVFMFARMEKHREIRHVFINLANKAHNEVQTLKEIIYGPAIPLWLLHSEPGKIALWISDNLMSSLSGNGKKVANINQNWLKIFNQT